MNESVKDPEADPNTANESAGSANNEAKPASETTWAQRLCPCLHPASLRPYFDVST